MANADGRSVSFALHHKSMDVQERAYQANKTGLESKNDPISERPTPRKAAGDWPRSGRTEGRS
jgi:hypothetical protein